jgi:hypothetical protein
VLDEPHDLASELPELNDRIRSLVAVDEEFRAKLGSYDALDAEIQQIELAGTPIDDRHAEAMKKRRLALKDELFRRLVSPQPA